MHFFAPICPRGARSCEKGHYFTRVARGAHAAVKKDIFPTKLPEEHTWLRKRTFFLPELPEDHTWLRKRTFFLPATISLIWPMLRSGKITFPAITWWWARIIFIGTTPGAVIAQWIRPRQPSCGPGFESSAQHFFSLYSQSLKNICYWFEKRTKIIEERSGKTHVKNST